MACGHEYVIAPGTRNERHDFDTAERASRGPRDGVDKLASPRSASSHTIASKPLWAGLICGVAVGACLTWFVFGLWSQASLYADQTNQQQNATASPAATPAVAPNADSRNSRFERYRTAAALFDRELPRLAEFEKARDEDRNKCALILFVRDTSKTLSSEELTLIKEIKIGQTAGLFVGVRTDSNNEAVKKLLEKLDSAATEFNAQFRFLDGPIWKRMDAEVETRQSTKDLVRQQNVFQVITREYNEAQAALK